MVCSYHCCCHISLNKNTITVLPNNLTHSVFSQHRSRALSHATHKLNDKDAPIFQDSTRKCLLNIIYKTAHNLARMFKFNLHDHFAWSSSKKYDNQTWYNMEHHCAALLHAFDVWTNRTLNDARRPSQNSCAKLRPKLTRTFSHIQHAKVV